HVRDAALLLFSSLKSVHQLPAEYREWLSAAAMLYEVGDYVNRNGHHRHTYYIIANSEILGYTPQQRRIIGSIARYPGRRPDERLKPRGAGECRESVATAPHRPSLEYGQKSIGRQGYCVRTQREGHYEA